ncbi:MAG: GNAT family N-acetyltransferase [Candidatus Glassbacteria bacterium]|nr:GNAT family N-acetyltransferase [Candidatus Glassbacteria bacterium]
MKLIRKADPRDVQKIALGADEYVDRLYGCFRFDNSRADGFQPERELELIMRGGVFHKVTVPEELKIPLEAGKAVNNDSFYIEPIGANLDSMMLLTMRAGWNQVEQDLQRIVDLDPQGNFVASFRTADHDIPVSTASVAPVGSRNTWIGMILVHPELRRQGIANAMMQHCVNYAIEQGKVINGLDATPMGNTVYGAVGYTDSFRIWRSWFDPSQFNQSSFDQTRISRVSAADLDELIRYDSTRWLARENIIRALFTDSAEEAYLSRNGNGEIEGYLFARPGRLRYFIGPFVADDDPTARGLLTCVCHSLSARGITESFIDTPESKFNHPGVYDKSVFDQQQKPSDHKLIAKLTPVRDFTRMYQAVDERKAENLVGEFIDKEKLDPENRRVVEFSQAMYDSVANYTETMGFMEYEEKVLQHYHWGTTGPEKG